MEYMPNITWCSGGLFSFYVFKLLENWMVSFLKLCTFSYICKPTYIGKVLKIAYLLGDLTVRILNLNDMIEYWNYVQPITVQETKYIFCA